MRDYLAIIFLFLCFHAHAEWVEDEAIEYFGSEISRKNACMAAKNRLITKIIQERIGLKISTTQIQMCNEGDLINNQNLEACQILSSASTFSEALIIGEEIISQETGDSKELNQQFCKIRLKIEIIEDEGEIDHQFDPEIKLINHQLREGEPIKIEVKTITPFFLNLFSFSPYLQKNKQIQKFYPNNLNTDNKIISSLTIPKRGKIISQFPQVEIGVDVAGELLFALATKKDVLFKNNYSLTEFNSKILEIKKFERKLIKQPYFIWKSDS